MTQAEFEKLSFEEQKRRIIQEIIRLDEDTCIKILEIMNKDPAFKK